VARDKASLDIFWLKDESLADSDNLPPPDVIAQEIVEDLEAALEQFRLIVQGKGFSNDEAEGAAIWRAVFERLTPTTNSAVEEPRYGADYLARARLGQGAFRVLVTDAYDRRCAVTGERTLPVLEAAHIQPYANNGPHLVSNGLLLRSDLHQLFDRGYLTITDDLRVEVSKRIREEFSNGREYYKHSGERIANLPRSESERPARDFLRWHNENVFVP
jgi:putative restriction endonuclease